MTNEVSPELINNLVAAQERELILKSEQINLQKQADQNAYQYSIEALAANLEDRKDQRKYLKHKDIINYCFAGGIVLVIIIVIIIALFLNKDAAALEILKDVAIFFGGGAGGYAYSKKPSHEDKK